MNNIEKLISKCNLIYDIGANYGVKTKKFLEMGASKVICFEPQPDCIENLKGSFFENENVVIVPKGVADIQGVLPLAICSDANTISTFSEKWKSGRFSNYEWNKTIDVEVITLDESIQLYGIPDYCKIDVEGYEYQVLSGLSQKIPLLSFEFVDEDLYIMEKCVNRLCKLGFDCFNIAFGESENFHFTKWIEGKDIIKYLHAMSSDLMWGDVYAGDSSSIKKHEIQFITSQHHSKTKMRDETINQTDDFFLQDFIARGYYQPGDKLRLHLGCGEKRLKGYINIDYPSSEHNIMDSIPDYTIDLMELNLDEQTVDEIRLHHVFEHFNRVQALALLIRWHHWLKVDGCIRIETPDILGSAETLMSSTSFRTKMGVVRHLAGDQTASWGYHTDHWFPERFQHTLKSLGFNDIKIHTWKWEKEPYLSNVEIIASKAENRAIECQLNVAESLLWESTVSEAEKPSYLVWVSQLREIVACVKNSSCISSSTMFSGKTNKFSYDYSLYKKISDILYTIAKNGSSKPINKIHAFNQLDRDRWVIEKAGCVEPGRKVIDIGAGTCRYRDAFSHCDYKTHDFKKYKGYKDNSEGLYGDIDYISDILSIPVPSDSFDVVICTEVLEHVPEPIIVIKEISRILRSEGRLIITAPLGSGLHQLPYHFYGGFTPTWYNHFFKQNGIEILEITPNGGFFKHLAQECARVSWLMPEIDYLFGDEIDAFKSLFGELLPRFLYNLDDQKMIEAFTVGYHIEAKKL